MLKQGILTISIDYEFALGFADFDLSAKDKGHMVREIDITNRLLDLFERYNIPATWAVTGHLLEDTCQWKGTLPHPEYPRPVNRKERRDWFLLHPPEGEYDDPLWFDVHRLIPRMLRSPVGHEVASHSYAHIIYGAYDISEGAVRADIENIKRIHADRKYPLYSFVFPRNREAFHAELYAIGVRCYRGTSTMWYRLFPGIFQRIFHLADYYLPSARTVVPVRGKGGMINIPDSLMLLGRNGLRRLVTPRIMKWKMRRGIKKAIAKREVFHLWFHPSNFWFDTETQFAILEDVLQYASMHRRNGELAVLTMHDVCQLYEHV